MHLNLCLLYELSVEKISFQLKMRNAKKVFLILRCITAKIRINWRKMHLYWFSIHSTNNPWINKLKIGKIVFLCKTFFNFAHSSYLSYLFNIYLSFRWAVLNLFLETFVQGLQRIWISPVLQKFQYTMHHGTRRISHGNFFFWCYFPPFVLTRCCRQKIANSF